MKRLRPACTLDRLIDPVRPGSHTPKCPGRASCYLPTGLVSRLYEDGARLTRAASGNILQYNTFFYGYIACLVCKLVITKIKLNSCIYNRYKKIDAISRLIHYYVMRE